MFTSKQFIRSGDDFTGRVKTPFFPHHLVQTKLEVNAPGDRYEQEADAVADHVMGMNDRSADPSLLSKSADVDVQRKCQECEEEDKFVHRKESSAGGVNISNGLNNYISTLRSSGENLPDSTRRFFEPRFGYDFSNVRIHNNEVAAKSARSINARAYTTDNNIVFNEKQYSPETDSGKRLLAHELTHVVQQGSSLQPQVVQRDGMGDVRLAEANTALIDQIRATAAYKALDAPGKTLTEEIITEIQKKSRGEQNSYYLPNLKLLFDTAVKAPDVISTETKDSTVAATKEETVRVSKPAEAKNTNLEEKAAKDPARAKHWIPVKGKFGDGTYYVDNSSPTDIVVRVEILLTPKGTGTMDDVNNIKKMEDGIEKAASNKGYLVDITFVNTAGPDTFKVDVDPSKWEVATNWSGGDPVGYAHELHHMFAFERDRYNYIDAHANNESMEIKDRLYWFREELKKPANYNDPTSIMNSAAHPNDSDACTVAGLDMKTCMEARKKMAPH
ncbi:MAG: eCIS core domain-containing protein [Mucilaginibacter sp.]